MGLDYIRAQTGEPWRRRWDGGLNRLKSPTLLDLEFGTIWRSVSASLTRGAKVTAGDGVIVQCTADGLVVSDGLHEIGRIDGPAPEMTTAIRDCGGYAEGILERIGIFGDTAEISVK